MWKMVIERHISAFYIERCYKSHRNNTSSNTYKNRKNLKWLTSYGNSHNIRDGFCCCSCFHAKSEKDFKIACYCVLVIELRKVYNMRLHWQLECFSLHIFISAVFFSLFHCYKNMCGESVGIILLSSCIQTFVFQFYVLLSLFQSYSTILRRNFFSAFIATTIAYVFIDISRDHIIIIGLFLWFCS